MQSKSSVLLAVGCVSLLSMNLPSFAAPAPQGHEQPRNIQKKQMAPPAPAPHAKPLVAREQRARLVGTRVTEGPKRPLFGWPVLVREARRYIGTNPTRRSRLWCATFMNMVLAKAGYAGTNSDAAKSFASYGHRVSVPEIGAIAVLTRGNRGGHVGVVSGVDAQGNPIIISGNHGRQVGEAAYPRSRVIAYVVPSDRRPVGDTLVAERSSPNSAASANRAPAEHTIDSPITELLAAIEAEQNRSRVSARPVRSAEPAPPRLGAQPPPRLAVQPMPEPQTPHLTVQQMPERPPQAVPQMVQQPLQRFTPQRQQTVQRRHVASADAAR